MTTKERLEPIVNEDSEILILGSLPGDKTLKDNEKIEENDKYCIKPRDKMLNRIAFLLIAACAFITLNACSDHEGNGGIFGTGTSNTESSKQEQGNSEDVVSGKICSVSTDYRSYISSNYKKAYIEGRLIDGCGVTSYLKKSGSRISVSMSYKGCPSSYINSQCNGLKSAAKEDSEYEVVVSCTSNTIEAVVPTAAVVGDETFSDYAEYFVDVCKQANEKL